MSQAEAVTTLPPSGAIFGTNKNYRHRLWRPAVPSSPKGTLAWIMLNPSTADATTDDATIRRCVGFASIWDYTAIDVVNLYGFRATEPKDLWKADDPIGNENDGWVREVCGLATTIVCAWGVNAPAKRAETIVRMLLKDGLGHKLHHLGLVASGQPKHPVRLASSTKLRHWASTCSSCDVPAPHIHCAACGSYDHTEITCDNMG